jgi:hypothetical protein
MKKYRVTWIEGELHSQIQYTTIVIPLHEDDPIEAIPSQFLENHKKICQGKGVVVVRVDLVEDGV